jgi:hypothetical protein
MNETEKTLTAYTKIAEQIAREDTLIQQRGTTGLSINAFLVALAGVVYSVAKERPGSHDLISSTVLAVVFGVLGFIGMWVSFSTIRFIAYGRIQNAYLKQFYIDHLKQ